MWPPMRGRTINDEAGRTKTLRTALGVAGLVFLVAGLYGFIDPTVFGIFDLTTAHNWIHVLTGALYAYLGFAAAPLNVVAWVARVGGIVYALLGIVGFFVQPGTFAPLLVLTTNENIFHVLIGGAIAAIGFMLPTAETEARPGPGV